MPSVPIERQRAVGVLAGLLLFGLGFLAAAGVGLTGRAGGPLYWTVIGIGFFGIGCVAFFRNRGSVPLPEGPIWGRAGLAALARAVDLAPGLVIGVVYGVIGLGFVGNIVVPLIRG
jgi:hypothetical protein